MPDHLFIEPATLDDLPELADLLYDLFSQEADFVPDRSIHPASYGDEPVVPKRSFQKAL